MNSNKTDMTDNKQTLSDTAKDVKPGQKGSMSLWDHLEELRKRIILSLLAVALTGGVALYFGDQVFHFFIRPLGDVKLHVTTITASFYSYVIVSALAGF
ncbi:MAG: twin-arginine translocase subunit TatC, partial [candidate division Zixibacteria bacterium]|nr:twin-arginine translocase subunit TatC [candidate division Zixibacteria bacterium]